MWDFPGAGPRAGFVLPEVNFPVLSACSDPKPGPVLGGTQTEHGTGFEPKFHSARGSDRGGHMWQTGETGGQNSV